MKKWLNSFTGFSNGDAVESVCGTLCLGTFLYDVWADNRSIPMGLWMTVSLMYILVRVASDTHTHVQWLQLCVISTRKTCA